jgi:hypothetical protein
LAGNLSGRLCSQRTQNTKFAKVLLVIQDELKLAIGMRLEIYEIHLPSGIESVGDYWSRDNMLLSFRRVFDLTGLTQRDEDRNLLLCNISKGFSEFAEHNVASRMAFIEMNFPNCIE